MCDVKRITRSYTIIHFDGDFSKTTGINVTIKTETREFIPGEFSVLEHPNRLPMDQTLAVAKYFLNAGFDDYDITHNNCEHFASICACGKAFSSQELRFKLVILLVPFPTKRKIVRVQKVPEGYNIQLFYEDVLYI